MAKICQVMIAEGVYWISIPEANLSLLCACPPEVVKLLMQKGFIKNIKKNGVTFETGPNAILLSDSLLQQGQLSNAMEFVILQMFYRQGIILPDHPNNTGQKALLIGTEEQIQHQIHAFFCGTVGLTSIDELIAAGIGEELAHEIMQVKLNFFFGKLPAIDHNDLIKTCIIGENLFEICPNVMMKRLAHNQFEIHYFDESITVDLNIPEAYEYPVAYALNPCHFNRDYFSIVHSGEGDGWNPRRSSMSSVIVYKGKIYIIDMPPHIDKILHALGVSISEVAGIFHTHVHDDHFAGILSFLAKAHHRIHHYATPLVHATIVRKFAALLDVEASTFDDYFTVHDMPFDEWYDLDGLEIKPVYSPHPVETNIFFFRVKKNKQIYTYAHLADIITLKKLNAMIDPEGKKGISPTFYEKVKKDYLMPVHLKKIDIDAGLVHGDAEDFRGDGSGKLALSHTGRPLTSKQKQIGEIMPFGRVDIFVPAERPDMFLKENAIKYLSEHLTAATPKQIRALVSGAVLTFVPKAVIKEKILTESIYLILTGLVEETDAQIKKSSIVSNGHMINEISYLTGEMTHKTYRAMSYVDVLEIPPKLYHAIVEACSLKHELISYYQEWVFWRNTILFDESTPNNIKKIILKNVKRHRFSDKQQLTNLNPASLYIIEQGSVKYDVKNNPVLLRSGNFFNEETAIFNTKTTTVFHVVGETMLYEISADLIKQIPSMQLKIIEVARRRAVNQRDSQKLKG